MGYSQYRDGNPVPTSPLANDLTMSSVGLVTLACCLGFILYIIINVWGHMLALLWYLPFILLTFKLQGWLVILTFSQEYCYYNLSNHSTGNFLQHNCLTILTSYLSRYLPLICIPKLSRASPRPCVPTTGSVCPLIRSVTILIKSVVKFQQLFKHYVWNVFSDSLNDMFGIQ